MGGKPCMTVVCFFHEWASYGRWGGDRTVKIRVAAMQVCFIVITVRLRLLLKICTDTISLPPHTLWFMLFPRCVGYLPIYVSHSYPLSHYQEARLSLFCKRHALSIEHSRKEASQLSTHLPMRPPSASTSFCKRCGNSRQRDVSLKAVPRRGARRTIQMGRL